MATPYLSEIRLVSFNYAPQNWALCNGQLLSIQQNAALFSLLGTTYGGNGTTTFALPNLQGRAVLGQGTAQSSGNSYVIGAVGGEVYVTLTTPQIPQHNHLVLGVSTVANLKSAVGNTFAVSSENPFSSTSNASLSPNSVSNAGESQPHPNMPPYLVLNYIIALAGIFPSRS